MKAFRALSYLSFSVLVTARDPVSQQGERVLKGATRQTDTDTASELSITDLFLNKEKKDRKFKKFKRIKAFKKHRDKSQEGLVNDGDVVPDALFGSDFPSTIQSDMPSDTPSDMPSDTPSDMPSLAPSDVPSDMPSDTPSASPSVEPAVQKAQRVLKGATRRTSKYSNIDLIHRNLPPPLFPKLFKMLKDLRQKIEELGADGAVADALFGSDVPSMTPSDMPSLAPSDMPSLTPSDVPSDMPSDSPSVTPATWEEVDAVVNSLPEGFEACSPTGGNIVFDQAPEVTVLYGYRLELQPGALVLSVTGKIEALLQAALVGRVCGAASDALAFSPIPLDIPSAACGPVGDTDSDRPCFFIAGRTKMLVGKDTLKDSNGMYCATLEAIRSYVSSGDIQKQLPEVFGVNSNINGSLVPEFCNLVDRAEQTDTEAAAIVGASGDSASTENKKWYGPGVSSTIGATAGLVALATLFLYRKHRNANADLRNFTSNSGSDLEHQHTNLSPRGSEDYSEQEVVFATSSMTDTQSMASSVILHMS